MPIDDKLKHVGHLVCVFCVKLFCLRHGRAAQYVDAFMGMCFILDEVAISISESCYDGQQ